MKGIITKLDNSKTGESEYGGWKLWKIEIDNEKEYTICLDIDADLGCKYGDLVDFDMAEKKGKLHIVKNTLKVLDKGTDPEPTDLKGIPKSWIANEPKAYPKDPVGLAVELFNEFPEDMGKIGIKEGVCIKDRMGIACNLVKQAQEAFK